MSEYRLGREVSVYWRNKQKIMYPIMKISKDIANSYKRRMKLYKGGEKGKLLSPRDRPINILKRDIYGLSQRVGSARENGLTLRLVAEHVHNRDAAWGYYHRPRSGSAVDWTLRLVRGVWTRPPGRWATQSNRPYLMTEC